MNGRNAFVLFIAPVVGLSKSAIDVSSIHPYANRVNRSGRVTAMGRRFAFALSIASAITMQLPTRSAAAQELAPLAFVQMEGFPYSTVSNAAPNTQTRLDVLRLKARWPLAVGGKRTVLLPGFSYERLHFATRIPSESVSAESNGRQRDLVLASPMAELTVVRKLNPNWTAIGMLASGLASDFEGRVSNGDWAVVAHALAMYRASSKLTLGSGFGYDKRTGDLTLIPLGTMLWVPNSRWAVDALLPKAAQVSYRTSNWLMTGFGAELDYNRFHVDEGRYGVDNLYLRYMTIKLGPSLTVSPAKFLHVDVYGGYAFSRKLSAFVDESPFGVDVYVNSPDPARSITLAPSAYAGVRLWLGLDCWDYERLRDR
ncbi:MAG: DUF6268 family outer membrane beta-barrel protein [Polyangiaceae bacterium]